MYPDARYPCAVFGRSSCYTRKFSACSSLAADCGLRSGPKWSGTADVPKKGDELETSRDLNDYQYHGLKFRI